jgi:hypothetical protein
MANYVQPPWQKATFLPLRFLSSPGPTSSTVPEPSEPNNFPSGLSNYSFNVRRALSKLVTGE